MFYRLINWNRVSREVGLKRIQRLFERTAERIDGSKRAAFHFLSLMRVFEQRFERRCEVLWA